MKYKILIVDDSETIIKALEFALIDNKKFKPIFAKTYEDAKFLIDTTHIDVAILDLELPDAQNGEIVDYALSKNIPSIVLTGTLNEELRKIILNKKIADYIVKNSLEDIYSAIFIAENIMLFKNKKVLILDDSFTSRNYLDTFFKSLQFNTILAANPFEAFELIKLNPDISAITIDYEMPQMNGIQFIQKLKRDFKQINPILLGVCGSDKEYTKILFLKNGANDYFSKPILKEEFNLKIANLIRLLEQQEELTINRQIVQEYKKAIEIGSIVSKTDKSGNITYANDELCKISGYEKSEIIGKTHNIFKHPQTPKTLYKDMWETILQKKSWKGILRNIKKNGDSFYAKVTIVPILNSNNDIFEFIAFRDDITKLIESNEELKNIFFTDALTSLGNRYKLLKDIIDMENPALAIIDIDRFKEINGFYGNKVGDYVLVELGNRLFEEFHHLKKIIYRIDADRFAILKSIDEDEQDIFIDNIKKFLIKNKDNPFFINDIEIDINLSAGISFNHKDIIQADMALKEAKQIEKSENFVVFNEKLKLGEIYKNNLFWFKKIRHAITEDKIVPFFQPIICNKTYKIYKYECLVRMIDDDGSIISPYKFLDIAKKSKSYTDITRIVTQKSIQLIENLNVNISINISLDDILDKKMADFLIKIINRKNIGDKITFELVESEGIESFEEVISFIKLIKKAKSKLAIDDFGTGYSNFEYLIKLKADYIKIDGSMIKNIDKDSNSFAVVETIVEFAKKNGYKTIAEFVSNDNIQQKIIELDIDYSQGYLFGEPKQTIF